MICIIRTESGDFHRVISSEKFFNVCHMEFFIANDKKYSILSKIVDEDKGEYIITIKEIEDESI